MKIKSWANAILQCKCKLRSLARWRTIPFPNSLWSLILCKNYASENLNIYRRCSVTKGTLHILPSLLQLIVILTSNLLTIPPICRVVNGCIRKGPEGFRGFPTWVYQGLIKFRHLGNGNKPHGTFRHEELLQIKFQ